MEKSARNAIFKVFFQNSLLGTFESKQTLRQQIKKQTFPKATFQRILRILLGNEVYHTEDAYRIAKGGALLRRLRTLDLEIQIKTKTDTPKYIVMQN